MSYENKLYKGKVTLMFESRRHRYVWEEEDRVIKSVTTALKIIAKPALIHWASTMAVEYIIEQIAPGQSYDEVELETIWEAAKWAHKNKKVHAGKIGTILHKWIESYIKGEKPQMPVNKKLKRSVKRFLKWKKDHKVKFLISEQVTFSKKYGYCGTLDFICSYYGENYVGDLKTSSGIYPETFLQTAAYRYSRVEEFPKEKYAGQLILRIGREDGTLEVGIIRGKENYRNMFKAFIYALALSNSMDNLKKFVPDRK